MMERIGQYELLERFAEGGMADVYFARFVGVEGFRRECAIKRLRPAEARQADRVAMFLHEARLAASLLHPNIVQVFDLGDWRGAYFIAMELVDGPHLGSLFAHSLRIGEPLPFELCAWIISQAAEGLHHAHTRVDPLTGRTLGIVHRDMSPQNVLISRWGDVKITDFGIAKTRKSPLITRAGELKGKLGYLSPEQCHGRPLDQRSDIFALGVMLYELLTRRRLYKRGSAFEVMKRITTEEPLPPSVGDTRIDVALGGIALRALRKEPDQRFQTARELGDALSAWLGRRRVADIRAALSFWVRTHAGRIWRTPGERSRLWQVHDAEAGKSGFSQDSSDGIQVTSLVMGQPNQTSGEGAQEHSALRIQRPAVAWPTTSFVGRRELLQLLRRSLEGGDRWLSLVGPVGVGKSRILFEVLKKQAGHWHSGGGAWRVDLDGVDSLVGVLMAVARHLNIALAGVPPSQESHRIGSALASRGPLLLVLDQIDGVTHDLAATLRTWLRQAPELQLLTAGRERMGARDERVVEVPPLSVPVGASLRNSEAVLLFAARAAAARPGFRVAERDPQVIARLVRQLDGLPLAIEFAAARIAVLEPADLLRRLEQPFAVLEGSRERSGLRDALTESWQALAAEPHGAEAQQALLACTVFRGGFTLAAAEAVLGDDALARLDQLRRRSLVRLRSDAVGGAARFDILHGIRAFVRQHTATDAAMDAVADAPSEASTASPAPPSWRDHLDRAALRHAAYYADRAHHWSAAQHAHGGAVAARKLHLERANIMAASRLYAAACPADVSGPFVLAETLLFQDQRSLDMAQRDEVVANVALAAQYALGRAAQPAGAGAAATTRVAARLARLQARVALERGDLGEARRLAERALAPPPTGQAAENPAAENPAAAKQEQAAAVEGLLLLAEIIHAQGAWAAMVACAERALTAAEMLQDRQLKGRSMMTLGIALLEQGDLVGARTQLERAAAVLRDVGDLPREALVRARLAHAYLNLGLLTEADAAIHSALTASQQRGAVTEEAWLHWLLGLLRLEQGEYEMAREALEAANTGAKLRSEGALALHVCLADTVRLLLLKQPARALSRLLGMTPSELHGISRRQQLRHALLAAHAQAAAGNIAAAEAACRVAQGWLAGEADSNPWDELALAIVALERAQAATGGDASVTARAEQRLNAVAPGTDQDQDRAASQWLRLGHRLLKPQDQSTEEKLNG